MNDFDKNDNKVVHLKINENTTVIIKRIYGIEEVVK